MREQRRELMQKEDKENKEKQAINSNQTKMNEAQLKKANHNLKTEINYKLKKYMPSQRKQIRLEMLFQGTN